jgi:hypothetical protein
VLDEGTLMYSPDLLEISRVASLFCTVLPGVHCAFSRAGSFGGLLMAGVAALEAC